MSKDELEGVLLTISKKKKNNKELDLYNKEKSISHENELSKIDSIKKSIKIESTDTKGLGFISTIKIKNTTNKKRLEAAETDLNNRVSAFKEQNKAFWEAQSASSIEKLTLYLQQNMALIEKARLKNKTKVITEICEETEKNIEEILEKKHSESTTHKLIEKIIKARDISIERIENDTLASKYGFGTKD